MYVVVEYTVEVVISTDEEDHSHPLEVEEMGPEEEVTLGVDEGHTDPLDVEEPGPALGTLEEAGTLEDAGTETLLLGM